jgi:transcriptional regulator with XRE-family HTH domain
VASISDRVGDLGGYLREQREHARLSLRQLAQLAGVSNPYLSQVERGLRNPSAEVLQQIARGLQISAEALYVRAGILESAQKRPDVEAAVHADPDLSDRQKRVLLDIYSAFRTENARMAAEPEAAEPAPRRRTTKRATPSRDGQVAAADKPAKPAKAAKRTHRAVKKSSSPTSADVAGTGSGGTGSRVDEPGTIAGIAAPASGSTGRRLPARRPRATAADSVAGRRPRRTRSTDPAPARAGAAEIADASSTASTSGTSDGIPSAPIEPAEGGSAGTTTTPTDD